MNHLNGRGLGHESIDDVLQLRQLFVNSVESSDYYQMLIGFPRVDIRRGGKI